MQRESKLLDGKRKWINQDQAIKKHVRCVRKKEVNGRTSLPAKRNQKKKKN